MPFGPVLLCPFWRRMGLQVRHDADERRTAAEDHGSCSQGEFHYAVDETLTMTMPKLLNPAAEKQITRDWQSEIPTLGIYKPRQLLRRVGPLLIGICLNRDSTANKYMPQFHVHCLAAEFPTVSLTLSTQLRTERTDGPDYIEVRWHEDKYKEATARMVRQSLLPMTGDLTLAQVLDAYRTHMATPMGRLTVMHLYRDMILLSAWAGDQQGASKLLDEALRSSTEEANFRHVGGRTGFEMECRRAIANPESIEQVVQDQIAALKLAELPQSKLMR